MSFATRLRSLVTRLTAVDKFGNTATFSWPNTGATYDRATGKVTGGTPVSDLVTTVGGPTGIDPKLMNGGTITERDQMITVEASRVTNTIVPGQTTVTINTKEFAVTKVIPSRTNDTDIAYRLVIR